MGINYRAPIEVRDFRNGEWFWSSKHVWQDKTITQSDKVVYGTLAFFANQQQEAFPSIETLAKFSCISERQIYRSIKKLEKKNYIQVNRHKIKGQPNEYFLLKTKGDKVAPKENRVTRRPNKGDKPDKIRVTNNTSNNNNTNKKNITIDPTKEIHPKKYSSIRDISKRDIQEIANKYSVTIGYVMMEFEKLKNYCEAGGKRYQNYKAALRNFVVKDMQRLIERRQDDSKRAIDASNL